MKQILSSGLLALIFICTISSCKKDWTCVCNTNTGVQQSNTTYIKQVTKKKAKEQCQNENQTYTAGTVTVIETCELQ
jgi:hypothetical protein